MEISLHVTIFSASIVTYTRQALYLLVSRVKIVSKKRTNRPVEPGKTGSRETRAFQQEPPAKFPVERGKTGTEKKTVAFQTFSGAHPCK